MRMLESTFIYEHISSYQFKFKARLSKAAGCVEAIQSSLILAVEQLSKRARNYLKVSKSVFTNDASKCLSAIHMASCSWTGPQYHK